MGGAADSLQGPADVLRSKHDDPNLATISDLPCRRCLRLGGIARSRGYPDAQRSPGNGDLAGERLSGGANTNAPSATVALALSSIAAYSSATRLTPMITQTVGRSRPHSNVQPLLGLSFIIGLIRIYPPRT